METGKPGFVSVCAAVQLGSSAAVHAPAESERMHAARAPLATMFLHAVPAAAAAALAARPQVHVPTLTAPPPLYSKETLPFLTLHIPGGLQLHQQHGPALMAATAARPKSAGKHLCPHCGRDCLKPSVLEKHLRCHTGERPYPCATCGVSFKTQSNLYKHKRTQAHARLCSESERIGGGGGSLGSSQDSLHSSRDTCGSGLSLDAHSEDSGSQGMEVSAPPASDVPAPPLPPPPPPLPAAQDTGWALHQAALVGLLLAPGSELKASLTRGAKASEGRSDTEEEETKEGEREKRLEEENPPPPLPPATQNRHLPLQRQEATLFSALWETGSMSRGKSQQSHDSTDSGFGESAEQPWSSSPGSADATGAPAEPGPAATSTVATPEPKAVAVGASEQKKELEERISKLISENDAVVDDKHLENVRPRKTMLSKQGSIDLPLPYTYKDSFHFEMRAAAKPSNASWQRADRGGRQALYSSVPTQCSSSLDRAPLTRSSSLPFSVGVQPSERSNAACPPPPHRLREDFVALARRGSSGHIYPAGFAVDQQVSAAHRPLVRQAAVDCHPPTEGLVAAPSLEDARGGGGLGLDGDGADVGGEPGGRKCRRKKTQKFAYNKWYMYGGGTFTKLYGGDSGGEGKARKSAASLEHEATRGIQRRGSSVHKELVSSVGSATGSSATACHPSCLSSNLPLVTCANSPQTGGHLHSPCSSLKTPLAKKLSLSSLQPHVSSTNQFAAERVTREGNQTDRVSPQQHCESHIPSERKKQRTDDNSGSLGTQADPDASKTQVAPVSSGATCSSPSATKTNRPYTTTTSFSKNLTAAKTSFLPKYQLKLPNAADADSGSSTLSLSHPEGRISHDTTCAVSSYQLSTAVTTAAKDTSFSEQRRRDVFTLPSPHTHDKANRLDSRTQSQSAPPEKAVTNNRPTLPIAGQSHTARPALAVAHGQAATNETSVESEPVTTATAMLQGQDIKPHTALLQNTPVVDFAPNLSATVSVHNLTAAASTVFTRSQCPALSQAPALSENFRTTAELKPAALPCHIIPYADSDSAAQNIFHVRTADLQICLQLISDEQLALIEPQIETQDQRLPASCGLPDFGLAAEGTEAGPKVTANDRGYVAQADAGRDTTASPSQRGPREQSSSTQSITVTEHGDVRQTEKQATAEPATPPTKTGQLSHCWHASSTSSNPLLHAGTRAHALAGARRSGGGVVASLASWEGVKPARSQVWEQQEHLLPLCILSDECPPPKTPNNQTNLTSEKQSGQNKLCLAAAASSSSSSSSSSSPYPSTATNSSSGSGLQEDVGQHKHRNQIATCNMGEQRTKHKTPEQDSLTSEGMRGDSHLALRACSGQGSNAKSRIALPDQAPSFPCNRDSKQTVAYSGFMELKPANSEIVSSCERSSKHAGVESVEAGALEHGPLRDTGLCESEGGGDTQLVRFAPVPHWVHEDRPEDAPGIPLGNQGPGTGAAERGCSLQRQEEPLGHQMPPWQPDRPDEGRGELGAPGEPDSQPAEKRQSMGKEGEKGGAERSMRREARTEAGGPHTLTTTDALQPGSYEAKHDAGSHQNRPRTQTSAPRDATRPPRQTTIASSVRQSLPGDDGDTSIPDASPPETARRQHCPSEAGLLRTAPPFRAGVTGPAGRGGSIPPACYGDALPKRPQTPSPLPAVIPLDSPASSLVSHPHVSSSPTRDALPVDSGPTDALTQPSHAGNTAHTLPGDGADRGELTPLVYATLSNVSARQDSSGKYWPVLLTAGQFHSYPPLSSGGVRPVQSSLEDQDEASSSDDDEGKLIIEL